MGNVDSGDTEMDFLPAERERGITISSAATAFDYYNHQFFLVDSPGHLDFTYEVERALRVMDGVVVLLDAVAGVQPQTETVWRQADRNSLARIVFVNKMDREGADFSNTVEMVRKAFGAVPVVLQVPIFEEGTRRFCGVFDLLELSQGGNGGLRGRDANEEDYVGSYNDLSPMQKVAVEEAFDSVAECVAEVNDDIMGLWLDGKPLPKSIMVEAIRKACICGKLVPVLCGSSLRGIGVESLMQSVINFLPSPLERSPVHAQSLKGDDVVVSASAGQFLAYAFKVTHDKHRGRLVHLRAFSGELLQSRNPFLNTTKRKTESATKLLRILADKNVEIDHVEAGDIFAAVRSWTS